MVLKVLANREIFNELDANEVNVKWVVSLARTNTSGQIKLNPTNISGDPVIDFNYLSNPNDYKVLVKGLRLAKTLCENTKAFKSLGCRIPEQPLEQCKKFEYPSHDYWRCFTRQLSSTGFHYSGTCRMGKANDHRTVVDSELKVLGIQSLRVADASIMPEIVNVNTQGAVYVIAEKAADMILDEWESL